MRHRKWLAALKRHDALIAELQRRADEQEHRIHDLEARITVPWFLPDPEPEPASTADTPPPPLGTPTMEAKAEGRLFPPGTYLVAEPPPPQTADGPPMGIKAGVGTTEPDAYYREEPPPAPMGFTEMEEVPPEPAKEEEKP